MNTLKGDRPSASNLSAYKDEEITRPEGLSLEPAWARLTSAFADLGARESHEAASLLVRWIRSGPEQRVLISALARLLTDKV